MRSSTVVLLFLSAFVPGGAALSAGGTGTPVASPSVPAEPREVHLSEVRQLTFGGENAEAYWSPDGRELVFQSTHPPYGCDQIFRMSADGSRQPSQPSLVSTGKGRTTCSYFTADGARILFSSTHHASPDCPPPPDRSHGYVWSIDPRYELWSARPDGSDLVRLTDNDAYDAETTVCPQDGSLVFTSTRDGDLELYRAKADGSEVRRLTHTPGYDGGAFFSPDCTKIIWRASRPEGEELADYRRLLAQGLVRPTRLEIWTADADGGNAHQVTHLDAASFAPSFFPSGNRILFSSNYGDPKGREFDIWAIDLDGRNLERITWTPGFDGFPLFSPDGTRLAFASNRVQGAPGETNVFVARWLDPRDPLAPLAPVSAPKEKGASSDAERYLADIRWLADDAREGRGIGTKGLAAAQSWLVDRFREIGLAPGGDGGSYLQSFEVPVAVEVGPGTRVALDGKALEAPDFRPAAFSSSGKAEGEVVAVGYGITAPELQVDDYAGVNAKGKIVLVRRFVPAGKPFESNADAERRYSELRYKAWNARQHGAVGMLVVDLPEAPKEGEMPAEAPFPALTGTEEGDAGIPVAIVSRAAGSALFAGGHRGHRISLALDLTRRKEPAANVVGVLRAGAADRLPGAVLVGAHYDHLGMGGIYSLAPDAHEPHNGADDNASGTAAVLEVARRLAAHRNELRRDVWFVAFSGEESGVLGSTAFTRQPPGGLALKDLVAMLNMDMVGRLREDKLTVFGTDTAAELAALVDTLCQRDRFACIENGDGYGPSDHSPFYAAGVPVLHFFTGAHEDYHKPSDDTDKINAEGGARVAALVAELADELADRPERLTFHNVPAPAPQGDRRSYGASLGTIPDYAGDGRPGVLLAGVRPDSAAEKAGLQRGDLLVELAGTPIRDIHDFMYVLQSVKPGQKSTAVVMRGEQRMQVKVVFGTSTRR